MRLPLLLLPGVVALAAPPQAWVDHQERLRQQAEPQGRWTLAVRGEAFQDSAWAQEDLLLRLAVTQAFRIEPLPEEVAKAYGASQGWGDRESRWLLLDPSAEVREEGQTRPSAPQVLELLKRHGFVPRWELREAFLKAHPDHGEARAEAVQEALALALRRMGVLARAGRLGAGRPGQGPGAFRRPDRIFGEPGEAQAVVDATQVYGDLAAALEALLQVPGWEELELGPALAMPFRLQGAAQAPAMAALADRMGEALLDRLRQDPHVERLWLLYGQLQAALGRDLLPALRSVTPVPGKPWPPMAALQAVEEHLASQQDWAGLLAFLEGLPTDMAPLADASEEDWRRQSFLQAWIQAGRARALVKLERWTQVPEAIQAAHAAAGSRWPQVRRRLRQGAPELRTEARRPTYDPLLEAEPLADAPRPPRPSVPVLLHLGPPEERGTWSNLRESPWLAPWGPKELQWRQPGLEEGAALQARLSLGTPAAWALVRGRDILAADVQLPSAQGLAQRLGAVHPSRLDQLEALLQRHPGHRGLQREVAELLHERMPSRPLEPLLCERTEAARLRPPTATEGTWAPEPNLWEHAALRLIPALEAELQRWPSRVSTWRLWLAWSRLHPRRPAPLALARSLPVWGDARRWSARLPREVHEAVAADLRAQGRFEELRAWLQDAWDGLDKGPLGGRGGGRWLRQLREEQGEAIVRPLLDVLGLLRRDHERRVLEDAYRAWLEAPAPEGRRR